MIRTRKRRPADSQEPTPDWRSADQLERIMSALRSRTVFAEPPEDRAREIQVVQTHISTVFLTPAFVFKFKRPVKLGFADFHTLPSRKRFCQAELRLNARLAPGVYLGVQALRRAGNGYSLDGGEAVVDYAVVMRRLPAEEMLDARVRQGTIGPAELEALAALIADFHRRQRGGRALARYGSLALIRQNWEENFRQVLPYVNTTLTDARYSEIDRAVFRYLARNRGLFEMRVREGFIRDGHGDLRCEHIHLGADGIRIIDCIEFNDRFRYGDVASDLAFLLMDLSALGHPELGRELMQRYVARTGDETLPRLVPFYACYRAFVRGKVLSMKLADPKLADDEARHLLERARGFFALSAEFAKEMAPPVVLVLAGLMGTGKSSLAAALASQAGLPVLSSDAIRKELAAAAGAAIPEFPNLSEWGEGIYAESWNTATYRTLFERARSLLRQGQSVILDASFAREARRSEAFALARAEGGEPYLIECHLPETQIRDRLAARIATAPGISDGRAELLAEQMAAYETVQELPPGRHILVQTDQPQAELAAQILQHPGVMPPPRLLSAKP
ncbi:MAG: AAA family ATPase [Candidatus Lambdaproteobacteria bacterium]|nr:AAA family ATPase [Candidatus Lambdaproteobacteria bacterium]